jgi:hypothetical protein
MRNILFLILLLGFISGCGNNVSKIDVMFKEDFNNKYDAYFQKFPNRPLMMDENGKIIVLEKFPECEKGDKEDLGSFVLAKPRRFFSLSIRKNIKL